MDMVGGVMTRESAIVTLIALVDCSDAGGTSTCPFKSSVPLDARPFLWVFGLRRRRPSLPLSGGCE